MATVMNRLRGECRVPSKLARFGDIDALNGTEGASGCREVKILMRLPDARNVAARQAIHGSAPCARTEVTGRAGLEFVCVFGHDVLLPTVYEDAGSSGGTLERPGLQRLLDDIDAGLVDQIVVYKVDRLTRCLADFAKLVERLEAAGAVFVFGNPVLCQNSEAKASARHSSTFWGISRSSKGATSMQPHEIRRPHTPAQYRQRPLLARPNQHAPAPVLRKKSIQR